MDYLISEDPNFVYVWFYSPYNHDIGWVKKPHWTDPLLYLAAGPETHVCISYGYTNSFVYDKRLGKDVLKMETTTISKRTNGKIVTFARCMQSIPGYKYLKIPADYPKQVHMRRLAEEMAANPDHKLSLFKLFGVNRVIPCLSDIDMEVTPQMNNWICSEVTMYLLQESEIIEKKHSPSWYTPASCFKELKEIYFYDP